MKSIQKLAEPGEIHDYVMGLWSDGPIKQSHASGGIVHEVIDRFARLPRFFYQPSSQAIEWTHFSPWWGGILLADYDNAIIRDLRFLHEIYHSATMPYVRDGNLPTLEAMQFGNERQASCFTEMAIYLELPELRAIAFDHPIFVDRFLFPEGDFSAPDATWLARWRDDRQLAFDRLLYERTKVILAPDDEVDIHDPQIVWLRRYGEQGKAWIRIWANRFREVQGRMLDLEEDVRSGGSRADALDRHIDWLTDPVRTDGSGVPFHREALEFRETFDELIRVYDEAMRARQLKAVRGRGEE